MHSQSVQCNLWIETRILGPKNACVRVFAIILRQAGRPKSDSPSPSSRNLLTKQRRLLPLPERHGEERARRRGAEGRLRELQPLRPQASGRAGRSSAEGRLDVQPYVFSNSKLIRSN